MRECSAVENALGLITLGFCGRKNRLNRRFLLVKITRRGLYQVQAPLFKEIIFDNYWHISFIAFLVL